MLEDETTAEASRQAPPEAADEPDRARGSSGGSGSLLFKGLLPLALLAVLIFALLRFGPVGVFQAAFPPVEELTIQRVAFPSPGSLEIHVVNGGPEPVTVSQVQVDEAYWDFSVEPDASLSRLGDAVFTVPYPWVDGEPLVVTLVTTTGVTFSHEVAVATESPRVDARYLTTFALLGLYVGVIPVFLGLLWLPFLAQAGDDWLHFALSFTVGLLVFLGVDALAEAVELTEAVASAFQGVGLVTIGLLGTPLVIEGLGRLRGSRGERDEAFRAASLIAFGIGLHNLGEGLAIGSAYAVGEIALGTTLVLGFLVHNTTEGIGIVAPMAHRRPSLTRLVALGAVAGAPTILGAWIGGFTYSPTAAVLFLAIGAGAVAQVVWTLTKLLDRRAGGLARPLNAAGLVAGLFAMWATGLMVAF